MAYFQIVNGKEYSVSSKTYSAMLADGLDVTEHAAIPPKPVSALSGVIADTLVTVKREGHPTVNVRLTSAEASEHLASLAEHLAPPTAEERARTIFELARGTWLLDTGRRHAGQRGASAADVLAEFEDDAIVSPSERERRIAAVNSAK